MRCRTCGAVLQQGKTDLPFKVTEKTIVILEGLPVVECSNCVECLIEDSVFARVEKILSTVEASAEREIIRFAA